MGDENVKVTGPENTFFSGNKIGSEGFKRNRISIPLSLSQTESCVSFVSGDFKYNAPVQSILLTIDGSHAPTPSDQNPGFLTY